MSDQYPKQADHPGKTLEQVVYEEAYRRQQQESEQSPQRDPQAE